MQLTWKAAIMLVFWFYLSGTGSPTGKELLNGCCCCCLCWCFCPAGWLVSHLTWHVCSSTVQRDVMCGTWTNPAHRLSLSVWIRCWTCASRGRGCLAWFLAFLGIFAAFFSMGEMTYWSLIDSCVKSWQYFPTQITSLNSVSNWLSYDIVRFKIKVGVDVKCTRM